jgi:hypothetical protein
VIAICKSTQAEVSIECRVKCASASASGFKKKNNNKVIKNAYQPKENDTNI